MLIRRAIRALLVLLVISSAAIISPFASAEVPTCETDQDVGVFTAKCAEPAGSGTVGSSPSNSSGGSSGPSRCELYPDDAACNITLGTWTGDCFERPATPQPPLSDPVWKGNTTGTIMTCTNPPDMGRYYNTTQYWTPNPPPPPNPATLARQAITNLHLPTPTITTTPPTNILINRPTYLTITDPTTLTPTTTTATDRGLTVTATATPTTLTITPGDGTTLTCTPTTLTTPPPNPCTHTYTHTSTNQPGGTYPLTTTTTWTITWTGGGQTGTTTTTTTTTTPTTVTQHPIRLIPNGN